MMGPIRTTRALPKRQAVKTMTENVPTASSVYGLNKPNVTKVGHSNLAKVAKTSAIPRGVLGEVTNNATQPGVVTRRGKVKEPSNVPFKSGHLETPKEEQCSPEVFVTPLEHFPEVKDEVEVEEMELDASHSSFVGSSGRTIDLLTGKELVYDLEKVVNFDSQNERKLEEYPLYVEDVFRYYRQRELDPQFWVDPNYLTRQHDITWTMRSILMDWLVDLQESFALSHETLYLSVKIVDLYLTKATKVLPRDRLQLVGITAVFIASKYEERNYVRVDDLVYMTEDSYTVSEVFTMEVEVLKTIGFQLGHPMSYRFLRRFAKSRQLTMECLTLARYILETSLLDHNFLGTRESHMAAGCLYLARKMLNHDEEAWDDTLVHYSAVDKETARNMALRFNSMFRDPKKNGKDKLQTVQTKYEHEVFMKVGSIPKIPDTML